MGKLFILSLFCLVINAEAIFIDNFNDKPSAANDSDILDDIPIPPEPIGMTRIDLDEKEISPKMPENPVRKGSMLDAGKFLARYGWLDDKTKVHSKRAIRKALRKYKKFYGLKPNGQLDDETIEEMNMPRCGMKDVPDKNETARFAFSGARWASKRLTFRLRNTPRRSNMNSNQVFFEMARGIQKWQDVSGLYFDYTSRTPVLDMFFASGCHGDNGCFDGVNGVLAHAYFPDTTTIAGDSHYDNGETWTRKSSSGINLAQVTTHEFGHALGLDHSNVRGAIMYPTYNGYDANYQLHSDDINGIRALYQSENSNCRDLSYKCLYWSRYYCYGTYFAFMNANCRKSCNFC